MLRFQLTFRSAVVAATACCLMLVASGDLLADDRTEPSETGVAAGAAPNSDGGDGVSPLDPDYLEGFPTVAWEALKAPFDFSNDNLIRTGVALGGLGVAMLLDEPFRDLLETESRGKTGLEDVASATDWDKIGGALGVSYVVGEAIGDAQLQRASLLALQSMLVSGAIAQGIKHLTGRARPYDTNDPLDWGGPLNTLNTSFPSGHTTAAFAAATVLAEEYSDTVYVPVIAYGLATGAAAGRMFGNRHWFSDVVAGGMIGYGVAQLAEKYNPFGPDQQTFELKPFQVAHGAGLEVDMRF